MIRATIHANGRLGTNIQSQTFTVSDGKVEKTTQTGATGKAAAQKETAANPALTERVGKTVTGAVKGSGAGFTNVGGTILEGLGKINTFFARANDRQEVENAKRYAERDRELLERGTYDDGTVIDAKGREQLERRIARYEKLPDINEAYYQAIEKLSADEAEKVYDKADELAEASAQDIQRAKQGLGQAGQFAVDVGVAGTQMAGDVGFALLTGGTALVPMAVRGFGSGAQEARQSGASFGQQTAYGAGSAALSVATEKLANVATPFKEAFGTGVLDKALSGTMQKLSGSAAGKLALSMISEGGEEMLEDALQPILQRITYDPEALVHYKDADYWTNMLYDGLVGAALGGVGSGLEYAGNRLRGNGQNAAVESAETPPAQSGGRDVPAAQRATDGVSGDFMTQEAQRLFGQQKAASQGETGTLKANTSLFDRDILQNFNSARTYLIAFAKKHFPNSVVNAETGKTIGISRKGLDKFLSGNILYEKYASGFHIPELIERGRKVAEAGNYHPETVDSIPTFEYYDSPIEIDGKQYNAHIRVKNTTVGDKYYGHTIGEVDDIKIEPPTRTSAEAVQPEKTGGSTLSPLTSADTGRDPAASVMETAPVEGTPSVPYESAETDPSALRPKRTDPVSSEQSVPQGADAVKFGTDGLGAADTGFTTQGMEGQERTSRLADSMPYDQYAEAATGMSREDYAKLFRYQSQTEGKSLHLAEELLYFQQDGQRRFILDVNPSAFSELVKSLDAATAWNGPQTDAARMIETELKGRSANMEIPETEYIHWIEIMQEHMASTGQGVQANAKWSRNDNTGGRATELEAWNNLENSGLSDAEKQETFRKIVQWDMEIDGAQEGDTAALKNIILQVAQERGVLNALSGRQSRRLTERALKALDSLSFEQLRQFAYSSTSALSSDSVPANIGQKLKTVQILNMLSNPKTAAKNLTGNSSFYCLDAVAMDGAAILDMAVSKLTGTRSVAFERAALGRASLRDAVKAMQMSIAEITLDVDMGGEQTRYGTGSSRTFKASGNLVDKVLSAIERNQAYLLTATDEFYKGAAKGTEAATQRLVDQKKIKTADAEYAAKQADALARYRTFQDDSKMSVVIQQIHDLLNMAGVGDSGKIIKGKTVHAFGAGDIVAPFTRVAGNLVSRGLEYSPVNAVKGTLEVVNQVAKAAGGQTVDPAAQAKGVSNLARGMTGTAIAYGFMLLAQSGLLRQADDEDDADVAALNASEGIEGTQLNITAALRALDGGSAEWQSGDTLVDLSSIEPLNLLMNLGTEMAKAPENPVVSSFKSTLDSFGAASAELPVLQSIGEFGKDVLVYGNDWKESALEQAGKTVVSSVTPNVLSALAKGLDDRPRNAYTGDGLWDIIQDSFKSRVPGLRETLPGSVNTMGEEKLYQGSQADILLNALLNPAGINTYTQSEVSREMQRVREATGDAAFYPTKAIPSKVSYTKDGETVEKELTYEQRQNYQRDRGATLMVTMADVMATSAYKNATSAGKDELLTLCYNYANQTAKGNVIGPDSVDSWVQHAKDAKNELGISTAEYLALYHRYGSDIMSGSGYEKTLEAVDAGLSVAEYAAYKNSVKGLTADKDANGNPIDGSKKAKIIHAINEQDLSAAEKDWLYYLNGYSQKTISDTPWH